jgi:hypothetical protein
LQVLSGHAVVTFSEPRALRNLLLS